MDFSVVCPVIARLALQPKQSPARDREIASGRAHGNFEYRTAHPPLAMTLKFFGKIFPFWIQAFDHINILLS